MLKTIKNIILFSLIIFSDNYYVSAQSTSDNNIQIYVTIPSSIAILDIEPNSSSFNLSFSAPTLAGNALTVTPNTSKWLNYTVLKEINAPSLSVYAKVNYSPSDIGVALTLGAGVYSGSQGSGVIGTSSGVITLTTSDQKIVQNIGTSSTGDGPNNGHQLTFSATILNYSSLKFTPSPESIVLTLTIMN